MDRMAWKRIAWTNVVICGNFLQKESLVNCFVNLYSEVANSGHHGKSPRNNNANGFEVQILKEKRIEIEFSTYDYIFFMQIFSTIPIGSICGRCAGDEWLLHRFSNQTKAVRKWEPLFIWPLSCPLLHGHADWIWKRLAHISHGFNFENILLSHQTMTPYGFKILVEKNVHNFWENSTSQ